MKGLNRDAAALARLFNLRAGTDVTGFSFLGHAWEMASGAGVGMKIEFSKVPFISCAKKHAEAWHFPGGASDNKLYYEKYVEFDPSIPEEYQFLLFDPQTSGGLLLGVPESEYEAFLAAAKTKKQSAWEVGKVIPGDKIVVEV